MAKEVRKPLNTTSTTIESMSQNQPNFAAYIFGGFFVGIWIYGLLFAFPEWQDFSPVKWFFWGLVGIVIAGGLYAARVTSEGVRVAIVIFVGVALGVLILAAALEQEAHITASFATATGAGLIASALPRPAAASEPSGKKSK